MICLGIFIRGSNHEIRLKNIPKKLKAWLKLFDNNRPMRF